MADDVYYDLYVGYVDQFAATVDSAELKRESGRWQR